MSKVLISWRKTDLNVSENHPSNSHVDDKTGVDEICQELVPSTSDSDQMDDTVSLDAVRFRFK